MDELVAKYRGRKTAVYGLGAETPKALTDLEENFEVMGLLDGFREDGEMYGKPVIPFGKAVKNGVELIFVAARPGSCRAIAKRIGGRCRECGILLMDTKGKDLLAEKKAVYDFLGADGVTRADLEQKIADADVVGFDFFDTLIMRQTSSPEDVIWHTAYRIWESGVSGGSIPNRVSKEDFCKKRLECEKELARQGAPGLCEIYRKVLEELRMPEEGSGITAEAMAKRLADLEWETDAELLVPRKDVCDIFRETVLAGKRVYIVSDSYYGKGQLAGILEKYGVTGYADLLSSSDYGTGKKQGLYEILKRKEPGKKCLHIGDDAVADVESAIRHGIGACRLPGAADLLEAVGYFGFGDAMDSLADRLKIGMFAARLFNSPFWFEKGDRQIGIADAYDIGYLICAPMICDFVLWFYGQTEERRLPNIWFGARDGYLIRRLYHRLAKKRGKKDESVYFLTSRTAAVRAGVSDTDDIRYVDGMKFSGILEENLEERFGIRAGEVAPEDIVEGESGLLRYRKPILEKAETERRNYRNYIRGLDIREGGIAFFDFVARGTTQKFLQRLVPYPIRGFYFLRLGEEERIQIRAFYGEERGKEAVPCAVYEDYYILETILTAPHPSVTGFRENGTPVYAKETRREKDIGCVERIQAGITDYFKTYLRLCPEGERSINRKLDEVFLGLVHKLRITDGDFLDLVVEDPFFNRMTDITDVL